jgi:hypothetical protein
MEDTRYTMTLEGVSALVMNSNSALLAGKEDKGRDPAQYELEHFRDKSYRDANGSLVIPARAIKKALMEACKFLPEKPQGVSFKSFGPFIQSAVIVPTDAVLDKAVSDLKPLTLVVNLDPSKGNKGPRGPRTRPMLPAPWRAQAELIVFDPILKEGVLARIAERAGKQVGILDGRAIDFGRCLITLKRTA